MTKDIKELIWRLFEVFAIALTCWLIAVIVMVTITWGLPMIGIESSCK